MGRTRTRIAETEENEAPNLPLKCLDSPLFSFHFVCLELHIFLYKCLSSSVSTLLLPLRCNKVMRVSTLLSFSKGVILKSLSFLLSLFTIFFNVSFPGSKGILSFFYTFFFCRTFFQHFSLYTRVHLDKLRYGQNLSKNLGSSVPNSSKQNL